VAPANVPYLFFVAAPDGHHEFRTTFEEHTRARAELRAPKRSATAERRRASARPEPAAHRPVRRVLGADAPPRRDHRRLTRRPDGLVARALAVERGGATMVQLRLKLVDARTLAAVGSALARALSVPLIVNDRLDVALACGAAGVHLGYDDLPVRAARRIAPARLHRGGVGRRRKRERERP
jgi:hypothetical protein